MTKISFVGAGSTVFMKNILTDILLESELNSSEITLYDIDSSRLKTSQIVADKVASSLKVSASIKSTNDRKKGGQCLSNKLIPSKDPKLSSAGFVICVRSHIFWSG